jgi:hypothetical protein
MNEEELLRSLPRDAPPPAGLEDRVVANLRAAGVIRRRRSLLPLAAAAALAVLLLSIGFAAGRWQPSPPRTYALLLRDSGRPADGARVAEYVAWSRNDFVVGGQKLGDRGKLLTATRTADLDFARQGELGGFFIVAADSLDEAAALALECPHVRYGGSIEVRPIER